MTNTNTVCDRILKTLDQWKGLIPAYRDDVINAATINKTEVGGYAYVDIAIATLVDDGYIEDIGLSYRITNRGKVFVNRTTYVAEAQRSETQARMAADKMKKEIAVNSWLLKTKWWPLALSTIGLILSAIAIYNSWPKKQKQTYQNQQAINKNKTSKQDSFLPIR